MPSIKSSLGNSNNISLDDICELISTTSVKGELNQPVFTEIPRQIFCSVMSISRAEFFSAGQSSLKPQIMLIVDSDEYDGEKLVKYSNKKYSVYRHFLRVDGFTELYCEVKAGGK
ncbi:hypothetical protein [Niallia sp. RD1]|uniref:hypothetical protein n=1 Tax=Niallia sp. RD1 TaxID=2962858 RepID=UPI0020C19AD8|nr:hypothetical protein [Niallia sp. RD1]UTI42104.1 hypothetical protein NKG37_25385 [Niallia sp. RD1]